MNQTRNSRQRRLNRPARQRGVATILIVLMVGLAVSVTVAAALYALRGNQQRQLASHSATSAQAAAWRGAEFMRTLVQDIVNKEEIATGKFLYNLSFGLSGSGTCIPANPGEGCEMPSIPDWDSETEWVASTDWVEVPADIGDVVPAGNPGFTAAITQVRRMPAFHTYQVKARITGEAGSEAVTNPEGKSEIRPMATSVLEVVYDVRPPVGTEDRWTCQPASAGMVFNGDLEYSGGMLGVENVPGNPDKYKDIVVTGNMTISGNSPAGLSACVKKDVDITTGGAIGDGGRLYSEQKIHFHGTGTGHPDKVEMWARDIQLDNNGFALDKLLPVYRHIRAGAYKADVFAAGSGEKIGTTVIGGTIEVAGAIPLTKGRLNLGVAAGRRVVVTLDSGEIFLLDLAKASSGASQAERLDAGGGNVQLPDSLYFEATGIAGGTVDLQILNTLALWGFDVRIKGERTDNTGGKGWWGNYGALKAAGGIQVAKARVDSISGGGGLHIAKELLITTGGTIAEPATGVVPEGLSVDSGNTPGLPGLPWCDGRVEPVKVAQFRDQANFIFEKGSNGGQVTIQGMKAQSGEPASINGVYQLGSAAARQVLGELMSCNNDNDKGCMGIYAEGSWNLHGVYKFPPGILWFDSSVKVDGTNNRQLLNTIIVRGGIELTEGGNGGLRAPNQVKDVRELCGREYYPGNLCASPTELAKWKDEKGVEHVGMPIGNAALIAEGNFNARSWDIYGSVTVGGAIAAAGADVKVHGTVSMGANPKADGSEHQFKVGAGGIEVTVPDDKSGLNIPPTCEKNQGVIGRPTSVLWSRYL